MKRAIIGIIIFVAMLPAIVSGIVCATVARSRIAQAVALLAILASCSGCAAIIDHDSRSCQRQAVTVDAMSECQARYPMHNGTASDTIAQPLGTLERKLFGINPDDYPQSHKDKKQ